MFTDSEGRLYPAWSFVLSAFLSVLAFFVSGYFAASIAGDHVLRFELVFRTTFCGLLLAGFCWLLTVANHVESGRISAQGLPRSPMALRQFAAGCALGLGLVGIIVVAMAVGGGIAFHYTLNVRSIERVLLVVLILLAGSLAEETIFRGYPFQRLVEAIGAGSAILVFSVMFGLMHLLNPGASAFGLWNTVVIGIGLSVIYLRTRTLWVGWGFHFAWNAALGLVFGLPVSGVHVFSVVVRAAPNGPKWLTGGSYGPEASVPGAIAVLIATLVLWRAPLRILGGSPPQCASGGPIHPAALVVTNSPQPPADLGL